MRFRMTSITVAASIVSLLAVAGHAGPKKGKLLDTVWVHPDFASFHVERIAIAPIATYDKSLEAEKMVEQSFSQVFRNTGYRWTSATRSRDVLRSRAAGGDSLVNVLKEKVLASGRVDSLAAPELCAWFRSDAVLSLRVEQWERTQVEWNQSGKPFTQVLVRAALVDSLGRLLWSVSGSQRGEGSYNDPNTGVVGVTASGLDTKPVTAQAGAPQFPEVLLPLFTRWLESFPARSAAADSAKSGK